MSSAWTMLSTGPKISVSTRSLVAGRPSRIVGFTKFPDSCLAILRIASIEKKFCALLLASPDQVLDAVFTLPSDDRAHLNSLFQTIAHAEF